MPTYTYSQLQSDVNAKIKGKIGILISPRSTLNQGVREVLSQVDMVSMRRRTGLVPNLMSGIYEYDAPEDLKGYAIITVENQKWTKRPFWQLVPYEQFMRRQDQSTIAVSDYNGTKKIFIKSPISGPSISGNVSTVLSNLDTLSAGGGTWEAFGDATNVDANGADYVEGVASISFDLPANSVTAGIVNSTLTSSDLSSFFDGSANCLLWSKLVDKDSVASFTLRIGSDASNYYTKTITGTWQNGWNALNFDLSSFTTVGTPVDTAVTYCAIFFTLI